MKTEEEILAEIERLKIELDKPIVDREEDQANYNRCVALCWVLGIEEES